MSEENLKPRRPYLLRAFYDWLLDNDLTPHLVVDATLPYVNVPMEYVQDGQIVLNIAPRAVGNIELGNNDVTFNARFGGRPMQVNVPMYAVLAIYARENGAGTMFDPEPAYQAELANVDAIIESRESSEPESYTSTRSESQDKTPDEEPPRPRPTLTIVK
ncbi:ClpXP protease specificity-enhancing factor [Enterovibrio baiacu]|uniref:ClpXP protease specificity-enhancing factor n=1 Tax=Enterovibrio baiacu TaxID=2491023 RepID=UPI0010124AC9|nr:ClpXP protease specificity-enhancing factor [Enterovibrio baiacu]MBE1276235.1 ClpXP protease specificity-enhancing factor [Enterovibrio baiacu]